jgi:hypothetical protein
MRKLTTAIEASRNINVSYICIGGLQVLMEWPTLSLENEMALHCEILLVESVFTWRMEMKLLHFITLKRRLQRSIDQDLDRCP